MTGEVANTCPDEPIACTAKYGASLGSGTPVSKPLRPASVSGASEAGVPPASTVHDATLVAPFQLA